MRWRAYVYLARSLRSSESGTFLAQTQRRIDKDFVARLSRISSRSVRASPVTILRLRLYKCVLRAKREDYIRRIDTSSEYRRRDRRLQYTSFYSRPLTFSFFISLRSSIFVAFFNHSTAHAHCDRIIRRVLSIAVLRVFLVRLIGKRPSRV